MPYHGTKRKVFISFHQEDQNEVVEFVHTWARQESVFIPKALGVSYVDDLVDSNRPEYVMEQIRARYLGDSTVTIVLVGTCTHSRRYVDWELKTSLRRGTYIPNGVMGIILPSNAKGAHLPLRLEENWIEGHENCYARVLAAPNSADELAEWIEDAYQARTTRAKLINNAATMMKYNAKCLIHGVTH